MSYQGTAVLHTDIVSAAGVVGERGGVVEGSSQALVGLLDSRENSFASGAASISCRNRPASIVLAVVIVGQRTPVSLVHEKVARVNIVVDIAGLLGQPAEQVRTAIPATQGGKTPVRGQGSDDGIVGVEGVILSAQEIIRDGTAEKESIDVVTNLIGASLIKGEHNKSVLGEVIVFEKFAQEAPGPGTGNGDVGVVAIIGHVRGDEHVLGKTVVLQIIVEAAEVLDLAQTESILGDRVEQNQRVVLADIVVGTALGVAVALVSRVGEAFLVFTPGNVLGVEQIGNGRHVGRNLMEVIIVHAESVTSSGCTVVRLRRVSDGPEVAQKETLLGQLRQMFVGSSSIIILSRMACQLWLNHYIYNMQQLETYGVLQPDVHEAVERGSLDI